MAKKEQGEDWQNWTDNPDFIDEVDKQIRQYKNDFEKDKKSTDHYVLAFALFNFVIGVLGFFPLEDFRFASKIPSVLSFCLAFVVLFWQHDHPLQKYLVNSEAYIQIKTMFDAYKNRTGIFWKKNEEDAKKMLNEEINNIQKQTFVSLRDDFINAVNQVTNKLVGDKVK